MKKNRILFILILFLCLIFGISNIEAKTVCSYKQSDTGRTIELIVRYGSIEVKQNGETEDLEVNFSLYEKDGCPKNIYTALSTGAIYNENPFNSYIELNLMRTSTNKVSCGNVYDIPTKLPKLTSYIVTIIQIVIPVILVIMGSIDLFKGITAQKEDEIKKGQQMFIKRLVIAAIIFFLFIIVKLVISLVVDEKNEKNILGCMKCFMYNECVENKEE